MARTSTMTIPDELKNAAGKALEQRDRFYLGVVQGHKRLPSKKQAALLRRPSVVNSPQEGRGSLFKYFSPLWQNLTTMQKSVWTDAGAYSSLSGWQLFISDNAARIRNSLTLEVPPSELWQVNTGYINIESPASQLILKQEHPQSYIVTQKIPGKPWKYEIVNVTEDFSLPLEVAIRYKSDLTPEGPTQVARFYARVWTSYQGEDLFTDVVVDFDPSTDWVLDSNTLTSRQGILVGYTLFLQIVGYRGTLLFDNVRAVHGGTNWARDPRCDDVSKEFTKAFAAVPPFWIPVSLPVGSSYSSVFPPTL